jgi:hypothetical protein
METGSKPICPNVPGISAKAFEELRYLYETKFSRFLLANFPDMLQKVILERRPEWEFVPPTEYVVHFL